MRSGLWPGHSVRTMTWVSERSGIASSGVVRSEYQPQIASAAAATSVSIGLRAHTATIRPIKPTRDSNCGSGGVMGYQPVFCAAGLAGAVAGGGLAGAAAGLAGAAAGLAGGRWAPPRAAG